MNHNNSRYNSAFTIVELLVVIVVIGILAAITIVSYTGISQRATASSLQSDLANATQQLKLYNTLYGSYPTAMNGSYCPTLPTPDNNYCLKPSSGNTFTYNLNTSTTPQTFSLTATNTSTTTSYGINDSSSPIALTQPSSCPTGFIPVPGSATYAQAGFCVMKYEAKQSSSTVPISQVAGTPWVSINQTDAATYSQNVVGCTGCHLITEAEWMTLAQNVLSVASNWSGGSVGSGLISSGHSDSAPANYLAADPSDSNGNAGETNQTFQQKRTLTLTNGQVIWDLAGNVWEWTTGVTTGNQPGVAGNNYVSWIQWPNITTHGSLFPDPFPGTTGLTNSSSWTSGNGIGMLISSTTDNTTRAFARGGEWGPWGSSGVFALLLNYQPSATISYVGFRVSR